MKKPSIIFLVLLTLVGCSGMNDEFPKLEESEAREIAKETCLQENELLGEGYYDAITQSWWFDLSLNETEPGCRPVCLFFEDTLTTKIEPHCNEVGSDEMDVSKENFLPQKEMSPLRKIWSDDGYAYYDGTVTVSGEYVIYNPNTGNAGTAVFFSVDDETAPLIPRQNGDDRTPPFFMFENQISAQSIFTVTDDSIFDDDSIACIEGKATVTISNYKAERIMTLEEDGVLYEAGVSNKATLEEVISKEPYSICE